MGAAAGAAGSSNEGAGGLFSIELAGWLSKCGSSVAGVLSSAGAVTSGWGSMLASSLGAGLGGMTELGSGSEKLL
jgi:hypothetical protein